MSTICIAFLACVRAFVVRPGRIVALGLLFSQLGGAAVPLFAFAEREVHGCGCVNVCTCGHAKSDATACPRSSSAPTQSLERCLESEATPPPSGMLASEHFVLELPLLGRTLEAAPLPLFSSFHSETDPPPPRF